MNGFLRTIAGFLKRQRGTFPVVQLVAAVAVTAVVLSLISAFAGIWSGGDIARALQVLRNNGYVAYVDAAGSLTLWGDVNAGGYDLLNVGAITFSENVAPAGTSVYLDRDNAGDLTANVLVGKSFHVAVAGTDIASVGSSGLTMTQSITLPAHTQYGYSCGGHAFYVLGDTCWQYVGVGKIQWTGGPILQDEDTGGGSTSTGLALYPSGGGTHSNYFGIVGPYPQGVGKFAGLYIGTGNVPYGRTDVIESIGLDYQDGRYNLWAQACPPSNPGCAASMYNLSIYKQAAGANTHFLTFGFNSTDAFGLRVGATIPLSWGTGTGAGTDEVKIYQSYRGANDQSLAVQPDTGRPNSTMTVDIAPTGTGDTAGLDIFGRENLDVDTRYGVFVKRVEKEYNSACFDAVGLTDSCTIWTQPGYTTLLGAKAILNTQFSAPGMTDLSFTEGDAGDNAGLLNPAGGGNLTSDAVEGVGYQTRGAWWDAAGTLFLTGDNAWIMYSTSVGANLNTLTAGKITFYFFYVRLGN